MSEAESFNERLINISIRCSIRFDYIIFPINTFELFRVLKESDYKMTTPPLPTKPPQGININFSGSFATKNGNTIDGNMDRQFFGVTGESFESTFSGLEDFLEVIHKKLNIDLVDNISFYENMSNCVCTSSSNPIVNIGNIYDGCEIVSKINEVLGEGSSLYNLKIVPQGAAPNQKEWYEITFEPNNLNPTKEYIIGVVYRTPERSKFITHGNNMIRQIQDIIEEIEKE